MAEDECSLKKYPKQPANEIIPEIGSFRRILPQILACLAKSLILVDIGFALGISTIVIPSLTLANQAIPDEKLRFDENQASWFGSLVFICQPLGCILSGWITDALGRKNAMILVNIPHIVAWLMLYSAGSVVEMYVAGIILGLGVGVMETPVVTYIGEICQPSIRGILTATTGVAVTIGYTLVYSLATVFYWRTVALICFTVPAVTVIVICFVPETPLWLLVRGHNERALRSLSWLRGWVKPESVKEEFRDLQRYCANAKQCKICESSESCDHQKYSNKLKSFTEKRNLKPFFLVTMFLVFTQLSGLAAMRPYLVQILIAYQVPIDAKQATAIIGFLKLSANLVIMASVKFTGKRKLSLISSFGVSICCLSIGMYSFLYLPHNTRSTDDLVPNKDFEYSGLFPMIMFFGLAFLTSLGIAPIPWMLLSEVLPLNARAITSGVSVTINYLIVFLATKTYLSLENLLGLFGVIWLYGSIGACGFGFLFFLLPETENRTLEEIELHFATQPITSTKIAKINDQAEKERARAENGHDHVELL